MIFLDTSFLVSYYNKNDENHLKAISLMKEMVSGKYGELIISDYIFDEFITVCLIRLKDLNLTKKAGSDVEFFTFIQNIYEELFERTWAIFKSQTYTSLSFTDCSILAVMENNKIECLATFDKEFEKITTIRLIQ